MKQVVKEVALGLAVIVFTGASLVILFSVKFPVLNLYLY